MIETSRRTRLIDRTSALIVAVAAALWASDAYFRPSLVKQLSSSQIVLIEDLLITACLVPFLLTARRRSELRRLSKRSWAALILIGIGPQALATVLFTQALTYAFPANAAPDLNVQNEVYLLYLLQPVFAISFARVFLRERRRAGFWPLAALGLGGVYLIVFPDQPGAPFSSLQHGHVLAGLCVLGAVALWGAGTVMGRYALTGTSFLTTTGMRFVIAIPVLFALVLGGHGGGLGGGYALGQFPSFLGIVLLPGLLAMLMYYRGLQSTPASMATLAELGYPTAYFLIASLGPPVGFGAPFHAVEAVGAAMLVCAVTVLNLLKNRDVVREPRPHELHLAPITR